MWLQGAAAGQQLVERAHQYMIRRTSETLKQYLPARIQEVREAQGGRLCPCLLQWQAAGLIAGGRHWDCSPAGMPCVLPIAATP